MSERRIHIAHDCGETPRTDAEIVDPPEVAKARSAIACLRDHARMHGMDFRERDPLIADIHSAFDGLLREIDGLTEWKKQAVAVMPDYQAIGKALDVPLGQSVTAAILPGIGRLKNAVADAIRAEREACLQAVLGEQLEDPQDCEGDEAYTQAVEDCAAAIRARGEVKL